MKIGILTHYYGSSNYGGLLQAYALPRVLCDMGFEAEQIAYDVSLFQPMTPQYRLFGQMRPGLAHYCKKLTEKKAAPLAQDILASLRLRREAAKPFELAIPHSQRVYTYRDISQCNRLYDAFITGSDQVWNLNWFHPALFLEFAQPDKKKISYAASMPQTGLKKRQQRYLQRVLNGYSGISVREQMTADCLNGFLDKPVRQVLDPTLLLDKAQWDEVSSERLFGEDYVFCYFLGGGTQKRRLAQEYAREHGLKLVTLPYLLTNHRDDETFGDYRLYDIAVNDFISLIKHAQFVFTDSFHATVFSNLYEKEFCVIDRSSSNGYMLSRLYSLLAMFGQEDRILSAAQCTVEHVHKLPAVDYNAVKAVLEGERASSKRFLLESLK